MVRKWLWTSLASAVGAAAVVVAVANRPAVGNSAEPAKETKPADKLAVKAERPAKGEQPDVKAQLPIGQVVLFSSGVGYFQREGTVEGTARVDLSFPVQDV